ncbi:MAG: hypothetical protein NVSMB56_11770 [Pyrinomonadaceae bacterium]
MVTSVEYITYPAMNGDLSNTFIKKLETHFMSVANEIGSEIASVILEPNESKSPATKEKLKKIALDCYNALKPLNEAARKRRLHVVFNPPVSNQAASGTN